MGTDVAEAVEKRSYPWAFKVHSLMCTKLRKLVDRILKILPEIERVRPGCSSGIKVLCLLNNAIDKSELLLQHCSESSKLYLAISGDSIISRCEKCRKSLEQSLSQIQNMVPVALAMEISHIIEDLKTTTFSLDASEEEAGKVVRALLKQDTPASNLEKSEFEALQLAALRLHITSRKALLTEARSIKNLLDKFRNGELTKKKILNYLSYLLKKYGKRIVEEQTENACAEEEGSFSFANSYNSSLYGCSVGVESCVDFGQDKARNYMLSQLIPPVEFKCPISLRLMYDPVVIASGQTFERMWIRKWFDEGHDICPKTKKKLAHFSLTPNTNMKDLISKWCTEHEITVSDPCIEQTAHHSLEISSASITSLGNSMNDLRLLDYSNVSLNSLDASFSSELSHLKTKDGLSSTLVCTTNDSHICQSNVNSHERDPEYLSKLGTLPWDSQCKAVEEVKNHLKYSDQTCHSMSSENFVEPLINFLKDAHDMPDVVAQRSGCQLLLEFVSKSRRGIPYLHDDAFSLLASFLDSVVTEEVLDIMVLLSGDRKFGSKIAASGALTTILKVLDSQTREFQEAAIKILYNMSSDSDTRSYVVSLQCIPKLVPFVDDKTFAKYCIAILENLCDIEEVRVSIAETRGCIASIARLLETGSCEDQERAVAVLISLCSERVRYCHLVMDGGVIPALFIISVNGNDKGQASAKELLRLLRDVDYSDAQECTGSSDTRDYSCHDSKEKKSPSKTSGFFGRKMALFSKPSSFAPFKKK